MAFVCWIPFGSVVIRSGAAGLPDTSAPYQPGRGSLAKRELLADLYRICEFASYVPVRRKVIASFARAQEQHADSAVAWSQFASHAGPVVGPCNAKRPHLTPSARLQCRLQARFACSDCGRDSKPAPDVEAASGELGSKLHLADQRTG